MFMALVAALALPHAVWAAPAAPAAPGWDRAVTELQTYWQKKHPDDKIVSIKRFPLFLHSESEWFEVMYPFELIVKKASGEKSLRVGANYRTKKSAPYVFTEINEDVGEAVSKESAAHPQPLLDGKDAKLFRALQDGDLASVQAALAAGGKVQTKDENGSHALLVAALGGNARIVKLLLENGAQVNAISDSAGDTALMGAVAKPGQLEVAKVLLDNGADVNAVSAYGITVLTMAAMGENAKIVKLLLDRGARVNFKNNEGITALMMANNAEIAKLLLDKGAEVNAKEKGGATALMGAAGDGRLEVAKLLLEKGANVNWTNMKGRTALMTAADKGNLEVVKLLLGKGAEVHAKDSEGKTAIKIADERFHGNIVSFLRERDESAVSVPSVPATEPRKTTSAKPGANEQTCGDACALLTLYAYDDLAANACKICKDYDKTFCGMDFPFGDVPGCDAYDELRNCVFARFGYVFSKPKWQQQFGKLPWYRPDPAFTEAKLPPVAKANVQKLKDLKAKRQGCQ